MLYTTHKTLDCMHAAVHRVHAAVRATSVCIQLVPSASWGKLREGVTREGLLGENLPPRRRGHHSGSRLTPTGARGADDTTYVTHTCHETHQCVVTCTLTHMVRVYECTTYYACHVMHHTRMSTKHAWKSLAGVHYMTICHTQVTQPHVGW